jgi:glycosyltransferase involved in cell wall biosynthesis
VKKIKILHTDNSISFTGAFLKLFQYIEEESEFTESVVVLPKGSSCVQKLKDNNIKVYELPFVEIGYDWKRLLIYFPYLLLNSYRLKKIAQKEKVDILKSNDVYNLGLWMAKYFWRLNKPLIVHVRLLSTSYIGRLYWFWRWLHLKTADGIIAVSYAAKKDYFNHPKVTVIYGGSMTHEAYASYRFNYDPSRPFRFLYLANYIRGKGNHFAVEAFAIATKSNPNISLTIVGGTFKNYQNILYKKEIESLVQKYNLENKITLLDFESDTEKIMKSFDAILNFSESESFSMVSFDALRFGIPIISTDCGGPSELFEHNISGLLVKNKSIPEMAQAIVYLSNHPELCLTFSKNSPEFIRNLYNSTPGYERITQTYKELLSSKKYSK